MRALQRGTKRQIYSKSQLNLTLKASAVLVIGSFICLFIAIYLAGSIAFGIEVAPGMQRAEWATVFFTAGLVLAFAVLVYEIIGKTHATKA